MSQQEKVPLGHGNLHPFEIETLEDNTIRMHTGPQYDDLILKAELDELNEEIKASEATDRSLRDQLDSANRNEITLRLDALEKGRARAIEKKRTVLNKLQGLVKLMGVVGSVSRFLHEPEFPVFQTLLKDKDWKVGLDKVVQAIQVGNFANLTTSLNELKVFTDEQARQLPEDTGINDEIPKSMRERVVKNINEMQNVLVAYNEENLPWDKLREEFGINTNTKTLKKETKKGKK